MLAAKRFHSPHRRSPILLQAKHAFTLCSLLFLLLSALVSLAAAQTASTPSPSSATDSSNHRTASPGNGNSGNGTSGRKSGASQSNGKSGAGSGSNKSGKGSGQGKSGDKGGRTGSSNWGNVPDAPNLPPETETDIEAYVQGIAAYAGPRPFVEWTHGCETSLRSGKPCWFQQQRAMGGMILPLMGGVTCMLADDPGAIMSKCLEQSRRAGDLAGVANSYRMENPQLSAGVLSYEKRHHQQLDQLTALLDSCVSDGTELTNCLGQQAVTAQLQAVRSYNLATCKKLAALPSNGGAILNADYCTATDTTPATN